MSKRNKDGRGDGSCYTLWQVTYYVCIRFPFLPNGDNKVQKIIKRDFYWATPLFPKPLAHVRQYNLYGPPMRLGDTNVYITLNEISIQVEVVNSNLVHNSKVSGKED